jgi:uncharacterized protein
MRCVFLSAAGTGVSARRGARYRRAPVAMRGVVTVSTTLRRRRAVILLCCIALPAASCQRAPPEEALAQAAPQAASAHGDVGDSTAALSDGRAAAERATAAPDAARERCVRPTPVAPPPPVQPGPAPGCPADPERSAGRLPVRRVAIADSETHPHGAVEAEIAVSPHDTERGLMYRRSMPDDHGMLFDLRTRGDHVFWMHNTCIPLDLLYADDDGFIVGIVENAPTLDDSARGVGCESRYVLEVNAGWCRRHGVKAGQRMAIAPL